MSTNQWNEVNLLYDETTSTYGYHIISYHIISYHIVYHINKTTLIFKTKLVLNYFKVKKMLLRQILKKKIDQKVVFLKRDKENSKRFVCFLKRDSQRKS